MTPLEFILSIICSILAAMLIAIFLNKKRIYRYLSWVLSKSINSDLEYVYFNKLEAEEAIKKEILDAKVLYYFSSQGNDLQTPIFESLFNARPVNRTIIPRILLPVTKQRKGHSDWTSLNDNQLGEIVPHYGNKELHKNIEANISFLDSYKNKNLVEVRRFSFPHFGRLIITDDNLFFTPYRTDFYSRNSRVYKFTKGGEMYDNYLRLFTMIWEDSLEYGN